MCENALLQVFVAAHSWPMLLSHSRAAFHIGQISFLANLPTASLPASFQTSSVVSDSHGHAFLSHLLQEPVCLGGSSIFVHNIYILPLPSIIKLPLNSTTVPKASTPIQNSIDSPPLITVLATNWAYSATARSASPKPC